jgi:outer membrane protein OmpA-like peptidoglycan-associated protein
MKKLSVSALALVAALVAAPFAAHADTTPGWYAGAGFGATFDNDPTIYAPTTTRRTAEEERANLDLLGNVGFAWDNGLRLEGEYFHNQSNVKSVEAAPTGAGGHLSNNTLFGNVFYDCNMGSMFTPYVGAGVGPDFANVKSVGANGVGYLRGDTTTLGYQGIVGVSAQLDDNWAVTADYRYVGSTDPKVDSTIRGQGRVENDSHNLLVGIRYSFGGAEAVPAHSVAAPMLAPAAGAQPVLAPVPQSFMVFFDFNKSTLTPEAKRIIASAAQEFKKGHYVKIVTTGHTDTVGTAAYNLKLSDRRAKAVEAELKKLGVSVKNIKESGVGKEGLLVPTADGVREAQNRRAEIVLSK